ncbi:MAG: ATPase [Pseudanabaena sp.]|nr:MAG: ATPase [Pseudanabaena sp.]
MKISIETTIKSDLDKVWLAWNNPEDIKQWNAASEDWHTTESAVDLRVGGTFSSRMEAKDGSMGFDFGGTFSKVIENQLIEFSMADGRSVVIEFSLIENGVKVEETFDAESQNAGEQQRQGWQSILNNFAKHVESKN